MHIGRLFGRLVLGVLFPALLLAAATHPIAVSADEIATAWFSERGLPAPEHDQMTVCHGFGCTYQAKLRLTVSEIDVLSRIMAAGSASPEAERAALKIASAWFERRLIVLFGGHPRHAGFYPTGFEVPGEMDCLDLSNNETALLMVLEAHGLLRYHDVRHPEARGLFLLSPHETAAMVDLTTHREWAIDPWLEPAGAQPAIMPIEQWVAQAGVITATAPAAAPQTQHRIRHSRLRTPPTRG